MRNGLVTFTVAESKRLIAKGVSKLPQVENALTHGTVIIAGGTTNGYIAEVLTGKVLDKVRYTAGINCGGRCCITPADTRLRPLVLQKGEVSDQTWEEALPNLGKGDLFIKGANALDLQGNIGILLGSPSGGTIGKALGTLAAKGIELIAPVGLEKLIPSVPDASRMLGIQRLDVSYGLACGIQIVSGATVITEATALSMLTGCKVTPAAAGGVGDSAGSTTLVFSGTQATFQQALHIIDEVKGEPPLVDNTRDCPCDNPCRTGGAAIIP
ncbi:MAG: hypothetical protein FH749_00765 [Firmicutes bacterium]|nr:hypothetical protein [Bacillota bacterium]